MFGRVSGPDAERADLEAGGPPCLPIDGIARVEETPVPDERGGEVHIEVLEGTMVDEQNHRVGVSQRLLDRQHGAGSPGVSGLTCGSHRRTS